MEDCQPNALRDPVQLTGDGFVLSNLPEPHRSRTRAMMRAHPELRRLFGRNPWTLVIGTGLVSFQFLLAYLLREQSWWLILLASWFVGAFAAHALFVVIHEAAHRLILNGATLNRLAGIFANLPLVLPSSISFERCHLKHHAYQGVYEYDVDLPNHWELKFFGSTVLGKAAWLLVLPILLTLRPIRLKSVPLFDRWVVFNWITMFGIDAVIVWFMGPAALLYLLLSLFFSVGLHPLGARWIQEHYTNDDEQETFSYYGILNRVALNVGYHNEHHDLPAVPWNRLPEVKAKAPEMYNPLKSYRSWAGLLRHFLFDGQLSIRSRVTRLRPVSAVRSLRADKKNATDQTKC